MYSKRISLYYMFLQRRPHIVTYWRDIENCRLFYVFFRPGNQAKSSVVKIRYGLITTA